MRCCCFVFESILDGKCEIMLSTVSGQVIFIVEMMKKFKFVDTFILLGRRGHSSNFESPNSTPAKTNIKLNSSQPLFHVVVRMQDKTGPDTA